MKTTRLANVLTPIGGVAGVLTFVAIVVLIIAAASGLGFHFDPFSLTEKRADRAEATATIAVSDSQARTIESAGADDTRRRTERTHGQIQAADAVVTAFAQENPDDDVPLEPDHRARLLHADQQLCALRPSVCPAARPAAAQNDARGGDDRLRTGASGP